MGVAEATVCVNEETRITLCSIRATKGNPPFSSSVGERKIMNHFVVNNQESSLKRCICVLANRRRVKRNAISVRRQLLCQS